MTVEEEGEEQGGSAPPWIMAGNQMLAANNDRGREMPAAPVRAPVGVLDAMLRLLLEQGWIFFFFSLGTRWEHVKLWGQRWKSCLSESVNERTGSGGCCVLKHS